MLKRIIKTHTARLDFCLYYRAYFFFYETLSFTNRERRVIASTNKKKKNRSVCLSGYTFRHTLMSHADILDIDRRHIFRKHRHKNNKKVAVIYEKMVKNRPLLRFLQAGCHGACTFIARF